MNFLSQAFEQAALTFGDNVKDLGIYLDNHDTDRFLSSCGKDPMKFLSGVALQHTWIGIPVLYYGTEQEMYGSNNFANENAEKMWGPQSYNQSSKYYLLIKKLNQIRDKVKIDKIGQKELKVTIDFYSYSRGNQVLVALTNQGYYKKQQLHYIVPNSPFESNTRICDILSDECINVNEDESVDIYLTNGQPRVYVRESLM
ncbi:Alpha_amylase [Hexamita inflata]|uniref:Alpha amylase n=1 Tax=Hexamita inflata TaxID=28002 RepID=A0AA86V1X1_9EUKA|nr:Alpha amylase [Hexamita inflata]